MEMTLTKNSIFFRSNICGHFHGIRNDDKTYTVEYEASGLMQSRGQNDLRETFNTPEEACARLDVLKQEIIQNFNSKKCA